MVRIVTSLLFMFQHWAAGPNLAGPAAVGVPSDGVADSRTVKHTTGFRWTAKLMQAARPMEQKVDLNNSGSETMGSNHAQWEQPPTKVSSCRPPTVVSGNALAVLPAAYAGRLHFLNSTGAGFRCSGAFISASVILTAGHCCKEAGEWHTDFQFTTQYGTSYPRNYKGKTAHTSKSWGGAGAKRYELDFCFIETQTAAPGSLHVATFSNPSRVPLFNSFGYARNYGDGKAMYNVTGAGATAAV
jgi:hypothetical protein